MTLAAKLRYHEAMRNQVMLNQAMLNQPVLNRRHLILSALAPAIPLRAAPGSMQLCMHQTTSAAAGYRKSLEGYARAGIKYVEVVFPHLEPFVKTEGMPAARKLLSDLGFRLLFLSDVC